ncbi:FecCD family ABC transporter permease [Aeromicrobium wangtongii]|uniref:Iron chelate uptake ABC transporter family permease subunit n=1 Tax=Aeromicrobium wangtongii TaxID=2969247 RepID=A0ABY5M750_9ACTN|nr:iron chelate uptake ABC transporter family permease subunit [Aeromicrobium wangtongii]MCD9199296.1 iron chelate uptake ABC transporter family permease subunit [Aeromicrobium wangtongii]UUP13657.1 iron chelate uptake ABC transporter family permease subunit [Aeromicrobium wangtongii]
MATTLAPPHVLAGRARRRRRSVLVTSALAVVVLCLFVLTMMVGSYYVSPVDVIASVLHLRDDPTTDFIVRDLRLPPAATALAVGVALGTAGTIFQRLLGNPLASPDFVGVSSGASLFAVSAILVFHAGSAAVAGSALVGALLTALLIYLLAWRDGITGYRFILIGIGVSQFMMSIIGYVLSRAQRYEAGEAMTWLVGSVGRSGTGELRALIVAVLVIVPLVIMLDRPLRMLELGDDTATALGARVEPVRLALLGVAIVLVGFAAAAAGPLMFVALIAGPVALRLTGPAGSIVASGLVGAIIVLGADLVAQHLLPAVLPTGVVTGIIGAPYLIWLLATVNREGRGG